MNGENLAAIYIIEIKMFSGFLGGLGPPKRNPREIDERSLKVIENTRGKGCRFS